MHKITEDFSYCANNYVSTTSNHNRSSLPLVLIIALVLPSFLVSVSCENGKSININSKKSKLDLWPADCPTYNPIE
jgi:hypothetical protein